MSLALLTFAVWKGFTVALELSHNLYTRAFGVRNTQPWIQNFYNFKILEDPGLIPSSHVVAHNHVQLHFLEIPKSLLTSAGS